jgi:hypothetical protein
MESSTGERRNGPQTGSGDNNKENKKMAIDYTSFQDNDLVLPKANGDIDQDVAFSTPGVDTTKNGILSLEVNPTSVYTNTYGNNVQRVVQENFAQNILGTNNTLTVKVTGNGEVAVSDCHVMFKTV